jgi:HSP20 family molecular chaperone IbpA
MTFSKFGRGDEMQEWSRRINDIMDEMAKRSYFHFRDEGVWQPATDIYETRDAYFICLELAGVSPEAVEVECHDESHVRIQGYRGNPRPPDIPGPLSVHVMEIDHGPFRREIDLPEPVNVERVEATYDKGYLWITLPKSAAR